MIDEATLAKWRKEAENPMMRAAMYEYCPPEMVDALDEIDRLRGEISAIQEIVSKRQLPITNQVWERCHLALGGALKVRARGQ